MPWISICQWANFKVWSFLKGTKKSFKKLGKALALVTFEVIKKTFQIELFCCYCFSEEEEAGRSVIYLNWSIRFSHPNFHNRNFFQLLCYLLIFGRFLFHQKESRNLVIILKFQLNGFFGECDIWAIFKSQIILQSFKNLIFWQLMLSVQIHWGDRSKWNDWWVSKHDDYCLENQFLLFLYLSHKKGGKEKWNVNFQSFFSNFLKESIFQENFSLS